MLEQKFLDRLDISFNCAPLDGYQEIAYDCQSSSIITSYTNTTNTSVYDEQLLILRLYNNQITEVSRSVITMVIFTLQDTTLSITLHVTMILIVR